MASSVDSTLTVGRESVLKQISVSEGVGGLGDELSGRLSLRSASRRSSQKSLAHSERSGATTFLIGTFGFYLLKIIHFRWSRGGIRGYSSICDQIWVNGINYM